MIKYLLATFIFFLSFQSVLVQYVVVFLTGVKFRWFAGRRCYCSWPIRRIRDSCRIDHICGRSRPPVLTSWMKIFVFNSLIPIMSRCSFKNTIFNHVLLFGSIRSYDNVLRWMPPQLTDDSQHWFSWWLIAVKQQTITWANVDLDLSRHMVSLGHSESNGTSLVTQATIRPLTNICHPDFHPQNPPFPHWTLWAAAAPRQNQVCQHVVVFLLVFFRWFPGRRCYCSRPIRRINESLKGPDSIDVVIPSAVDF